MLIESDISDADLFGALYSETLLLNDSLIKRLKDEILKKMQDNEERTKFFM